MAITAVDKMRINKYLKECRIDELSYLDMCDTLGKRGKISYNEFLEYFTNYVVSAFNKSEKVSMKHLAKVVAIVQSFLVWMDKENVQVNLGILDKIRGFDDLYENYLVISGVEEDLDFKNNYIDGVLEVLNELYPVEDANENVSGYIRTINELEDRVKVLTQELSGITCEHGQLVKAYDKKVDGLEKLKQTVKSLQVEIKSKTQEVVELKKKLGTLTGKKDIIEDLYSQRVAENKILSGDKETLIAEAEELRKELEEARLVQQIASELDVKNLKIQELLYKKLLSGKLSINQLQKYVKDSGVECTSDEIVGLIKSLGNEINVIKSSFSLSPMYQIVQPNLLQDSQFSINIPSGFKHFDLVAVSDFHLTEFNKETLDSIYSLNEYCAKTGVRLVLNLGDFYDGFGISSTSLNYNDALRNYNVVEQAISLFPKSNNLYHAILGGNHEMKMSKYGFDPVQLLADSRDDFINLGYLHSTILLDGTSGTIGSFDVHHPDSFDICARLNNKGVDLDGASRYLDNIYEAQGRNRDDSYIDLFGHMHKSRLNCMSSYCYVPPYFKEGAYHFKFYFNDDNSIKYLICMPLALTSDSKLIKTSEIVYQKKLNR